MLMLNNEIFGYPPIDLTYGYKHGLFPWKIQITWEKVLFASSCSFRDNGYPFVMFRPLYNVYLFTLRCFFRENGFLSYWFVSSMRTTIYLCLVVSSVVMAIYSCCFVSSVIMFLYSRSVVSSVITVSYRHGKHFASAYGRHIKRC